MFQFLAAICTISLFVLLVAACGSSGPKKPQPQPHIVKIGHSSDNEGSDQFKLARVPMPNGGKLICVMFHGYHETAISCDWSGYHGAH